MRQLLVSFRSFRVGIAVICKSFAPSMMDAEGVGLTES